MNHSLSGPPPGKVATSQVRRAQHFVENVARARALVGYTPEDEQLVKVSAGAVLPHADEVARALYQHLLSRPETALYFTLADGRPDSAHIAARVDSLKAWLLHVIDSPLDERAVQYAAGVGQAHVRRSEGGSPSVKGRYMVASMAFLLAALTPFMADVIDDRRDLASTIVAWDKLLTIHLDLFLAVQASAAKTPHWY